MFERVTSDFLSTAGIDGPKLSHFGFGNDPFVFVTANGTVDEIGFSTSLRSPYLNGMDHAQECLRFWFDFQVLQGVQKNGYTRICLVTISSSPCLR